MKKCLILLLISWSLQTQAQATKKIFLEHFTNTKCSVCFSRNPGLLDNLKKHPEVLFVSIHPSSPYSACPLSLANKLDNDARTNHYTIYGSTPRIVLNGSVISSSANYSDTGLFNSYSGKSAFTIKIQQMSVGQDSIKSIIAIRRVDNMSPTGSASLYTMLIEDTVFLNGGNGEKIHINVARKMLCPADGETITLPQNVGDSLVVVKMAYRNNSWSMKRMSTVAVLQELMTKTLVQSEVSAKGIDFAIPSSLNNQSIQLVDIMPNPANDKIQIIEHDNMEEWFITDLSGRICIQSGNKGIPEIDISNLKAGFYFNLVFIFLILKSELC